MRSTDPFSIPGDITLGLAPEPVLGPLSRRLSDVSRTAFRLANRWMMIPLHQAGLSAWLGNPLTGWQLLLITTGRRTGLARPTPLGYLVTDGAAWVLAGYGPSTLWYRNLLAEPSCTVRLPARTPMAARASEVTDASVRGQVIPALVRSMRLPGMMVDADLAHEDSQRILEATSWVPLIRLDPLAGPIAAGPDDPGGRGWVWRQALVGVVTVGVTWLSCRVLRAFRGR